jgi:hypothetical protein
MQNQNCLDPSALIFFEAPTSFQHRVLDQRLDRRLRLGKIFRVCRQVVGLREIERDEYGFQQLAGEVAVTLPLAQGDERHVILERHLLNKGGRHG